MDFGKTYHDGRRILGDGKTWAGFIGGVLAGGLIGCLEIMLQNAGYLTFLPYQTTISIIILPIGALLGDMIKSFFKRRKGISRGEKWPLVDQYDFLIGALVLLLIADSSYVMTVYTLPIIITLLILTPLLHRTVNIIGYYAGVKDVPW